MSHLTQYARRPQAFPGKGHLHPADEELRQMRKQTKDLKEENAILKKSHGHLHKRRAKS